jgi:putative resolvase
MLKLPKTLAKWARLGWIVSMPLPGPGVRQHRLFDMRSVHRAPVQPVQPVQAVDTVDENPAPCMVDHTNDNRFDAIYVRVSTNDQSKELDSQLETLQHKYPNARVFRDVASGMNFRRPALRALLVHAFAGRVQHVYIADRDRLCRFAYELIEFVLQSHGCDIVVDAPHASHSNVEHNTELADDIVNTITVFAAHLYGARGGGKRHREPPSDGSSEESAKRHSDTGKQRVTEEFESGSMEETSEVS